MFRGLLVIVAILLVGCGSTKTINSTDVKESVIYRDYYASFDAEKGVTYLYAQFRVGGGDGTTVRLQSPSAIKVDGRPLDLVDGEIDGKGSILSHGTFYRARLHNRDMEKSHVFTWVKNDGSEEKVTLAMPQPLKLSRPKENQTVELAKRVEAQWEGSPNTADELIDVITAHYAYRNPPVSKAVTAASGELFNLSDYLGDSAQYENGRKLSVAFRRVRTTKVDKAAGSFYSEYVTPSVTLVVKK